MWTTFIDIQLWLALVGLPKRSAKLAQFYLGSINISDGEADGESLYCKAIVDILFILDTFTRICKFLTYRELETHRKVNS